MAAKKKKKKPPGGAAGAPPRSEPRVQIFSKFAGCNFQLATRDFDNLFGEDQDAQTDLMPMQMAIQNNAAIAPFGGIETRQNLVPLFTAPRGKNLTGVATLIGDRLYAACNDMTVRYGQMSDGEAVPETLWGKVGEIEDWAFEQIDNKHYAVFTAPANSDVLTSIYMLFWAPSGFAVTMEAYVGSTDGTPVVTASHAEVTGSYHEWNFSLPTYPALYPMALPGDTVTVVFTVTAGSCDWSATAMSATFYQTTPRSYMRKGYLGSQVSLVDNNASYVTAEEFPYGPNSLTPVNGSALSEEVVTFNNNPGWNNLNGSVEIGMSAGTATLLKEITTTGDAFRIAYNGVPPNVYAGGYQHLIVWDSEGTQVRTGDVYFYAQPSWPEGIDVISPVFDLPPGTYTIGVYGEDEGYSWGGSIGQYNGANAVTVYESYHMWTFTQAHTVEAADNGVAILTRVRYHLASSHSPAHTGQVSVYKGAIQLSNRIYYSAKLPDTDITLDASVVTGDVITVVVETQGAPTITSQTVTFYEATENNTWTFLGYADDQLVGMTANEQIWNGPTESFLLENAKRIPDPAILAIGNIIGGTGINVSPTYHVTNYPYRVGVSYTLLNEFGPTLPSPQLFFYASQPTIKWTTSAYVTVNCSVALGGAAPLGYKVKAVELYFTEGDAQDPALLGRVNLVDDATTWVTGKAYGVGDRVYNPSNPAQIYNCGTAHTSGAWATDVTTKWTLTTTAKPWSFVWTGYDKSDTSMWTIANLTVPTQNFTEGVPASKMSVLDGALYFWGNAENPYRIWIGGNPGNRFSVSPGTGGGFVDVEPGTGTKVANVLKFKTQQGAAIVTALCDNKNSQREARYNLVESTISISDEQSIKGWMAEKIAGAVGCKSSTGAVAAGDGLYAVSRYGLAITTLTMEYNSQLQIMYVSDPIAPVFLKQYGNQLEASILLAVNGVLYMTFGTPDGTLDNVLFCYDIMLKAWWTYTLNTDTPILNLVHIDYEGRREGIGVITKDAVLLLPTTMDEGFDVLPEHEVLIETGELTTMQPLQGMHHLSQLEFRFDYFVGDMDIVVTLIDQFGRTLETVKRVHHATRQHQVSEYVRIDAVVESYKVVLRGKAKMRMTHFIAKLYPKSNRIGMLGGFDSSQRHMSKSIRSTFNSYNDLKEAIIP